jgi:signal peptidase
LQRLRIHGAAVPLFTLITVYSFLSLSSFAGIWAYVIPSVCWIALALITLKIYGISTIRLKFDKSLTLLAALTAITQIITLVSIAIFTSFGRSPYASSSMALNVLYFSSTLIGTELARAQLVTTFPRQRRLIGIALVATLFAIVNFSPARYLSLGEPIETTKFLGSNLLPTIAGSILATYLALLGGPLASIAYMGTLQTFEWLSPILPNPDWTIQALIGTLIPAIGFITINETVKPFTLFRHGLITRKELTQKTRKNKQSFPFGWIAIALAALILMWSNSGLLGFQPSIVASGSMQPNLNVGDITIIIHTKPDDINIGDIIQYRTTEEPIIHRVIDKYTEAGQTWFITKGDANNAPDPKPVNEQQIIGKATLTIPKLGWISIYLKTAFTTAASFLLNNVTAAYATIGLILTDSAFRIHKYRNQPLNKLKRKFRK